VKFPVDAHLPRRMIRWFGEAGCEAMHTVDRLGEEPAVVVADDDHRHVRGGPDGSQNPRGHTRTPGSSPGHRAAQCTACRLPA
jgi:hypothetical protein